MTSLIALPATAPATEVASTALGEPLTNIVVVKIRPVSIAYGDQEKRYPGSTKYTAVLVKANSGKKIVLLQYRSNKEHSGWWSQIYDSE
jgi:hypothetical protein